MDCQCNSFNPLNLTGKRYLVTGASSGIGRACALMIARLGATVVLLGRDSSRLQATRQEMQGDGHVLFPFDLLEFERYEEVFRFSAAQQKLHGLVHAAGVCPAIPVQSLSPTLMQESMGINYYAFLLLMKFFSKKIYSDGGSAVAISSVSGTAGWAGGSLYSGTKGAVDSAVRSLAIELAGKKIRVNSVVPSHIKTPMYEGGVAQMNDAAGLQKMLEKQPLGLGEPEDVAHAVAFLLSDASRFITGTQLVVDGGYLAQ